MHQKITSRLLLLCSILSTFYLVSMDSEGESVASIKKYFRKQHQLLSALTPIDDVLFKTNDTLVKLKQIMTLTRNGFDLLDEHLSELSRCHTDAMIIKACAEKALIADEELQTITDDQERTVYTRLLIKKIRQDYPAIFNNLKNVQLNIATALLNLTKPICNFTRPKMDISQTNTKDFHSTLKSCSNVGFAVKTGCAFYQKKRAVLKQLLPLYEYFLTADQMSRSYAPILEWLEQGVDYSLCLYQQCKKKSLETQENLIAQLTMLVAALKKSKQCAKPADMPELKKMLDSGEDVIKEFFKSNELDGLHFIEKNTIERFNTLKKAAEREIIALKELTETTEPKTPEFVSSFKLVNRQEIAQEAKAYPFYVIVPTMENSVLRFKNTTINPKSVFLGSSKTYKLPLSKVGKINSRKRLLPVKELIRETSEEIIRLIFDEKNPSQVWQDHAGHNYISDVTKDTEYAYRIEQIMTVTPHPQKTISSTFPAGQDLAINVKARQ